MGFMKNQKQASSLRIRLQRFGQRHRPHYRIVAAHRKAPRDGKFIEILGHYDPIPDRAGNKKVSVNVDRVQYWVMNGAEPSERVQKLFGIAQILPPAPRRWIPERPLLDDEFIQKAAEDAMDVEEPPSGDGGSDDAPEGAASGEANTQAAT